MGALVTHGIQVTARVRFERGLSDPLAQQFLFQYRITIANRSEEAVQLLSRRWVIHDSLAPTREVEGPGVVGETPLLQPGEEFTYSSACDLRSGFGRMEGTYLMQRISDGQRFHVTVPEMHFSYPIGAN